MFIKDHPELYETFLVQNRRFWRENGNAASEGDIIVDAAHDNPVYLFTNLLLAKYLQRLRGGRIVAVQKSWADACPHYNADVVRRFVESFVVDEIIDIDAAIGADSGQRAMELFDAATRGKSGASLRKAVLDFHDEAREPNLGVILYDTYIRGKRTATFDVVDDDLRVCASAVFATAEAVAGVYQNRNVVAAVVGHHVYSPYTFLALNTIRAGARVFFQSLLLPFSITEFRSIEDLRRGRPASFVSAYRNVLSRVPRERIERFARRVFEVQEASRHFFRRVVTDPANALDREQLLQALELDAGRSSIAVYVPALCGAPHAFGKFAFNDFAEWLEETLACVAKNTKLNVIVKPHPMDHVYDTSGFIAGLAARFSGAGNIRFLSTETSSDDIRACCDLVVTANGTPGYEMVLRGVPTVTAAPSRYSDLGFTCETLNRDAYFSTLRAAGERALTPDVIWSATEFAFFELVAKRCHSVFLPLPDTAGTAEFWKQAIHNLKAYSPEEDQLFRNFRAMLDSDSPFLVNVDIAGLPRG